MMRPTFCLETTSANHPGRRYHIPEEWRSQDSNVVLMGTYVQLSHFRLLTLVLTG